MSEQWRILGENWERLFSMNRPNCRQVLECARGRAHSAEKRQESRIPRNAANNPNLEESYLPAGAFYDVMIDRRPQATNQNGKRIAKKRERAAFVEYD